MAKKLMLIGGGNMARAIVTGLLHHGFNADHLYIVDHNKNKRDYFKSLSTHVSDKAETFLTFADICILAIKPQGAKKACLALGKNLAGKSPVMISLMAGVPLSKLKEWIGEHLTIIRAMPNTPATIQLGMTGLFTDIFLTPEQRADVEKIMQSIGQFAWLETESQINAVTALSGSGPAYYFYFIDCMIQAAMDLGLPAEIAKTFAIETAYGAITLARESNQDMAGLRRQVTSKKGTTEAAINVMDESGIPIILANAIKAAYQRAVELSEETASI